MTRLRQLRRDGKADPAWDNDPVIAILLATADVAPPLARDVARKLRVELPTL